MASHIGSDFSSLKNRVERFGTQSNKLAEGILFGKNTGSDYMYQLYVDDGVSERGDRKNMMNPAFQWTGIAHCKHTKQDEMLVVVYAGALEGERIALEPENFNEMGESRDENISGSEGGYGVECKARKYVVDRKIA